MANPYTVTPPELEATDKDAQEIRRLRSTHELYDKYLPRWELQLASYEGGPAFANKDNLIKHARENAEDFNDRLRRMHYMNYVKSIVNYFTNFIFAETIQRDGGKNAEFYTEFIQDVDMRGHDVASYMKDTSDEMQIFGFLYHLVDAPIKPETDTGRPLTSAEEKELGLRPYWVRIRPMEILDWVRDEFGKFMYAKRKQCTYTLDGNRKVSVEKYTEWFTDRIVVTLVDVTEIAKPKILTAVKLTNELEKVPLYLTIFQESKEDPEMGLSFINDIAYHALDILNITSLIDEFLAKQCFPILAKEAEPGLPSREQNQGEIGEANAIEVPKDAKFPLYIAPPTDPAKFLQAERELVKLEMFRVAAQDTMTEMFNGDQASGFSKASSFAKSMPHIATRADRLENTEMALMSLTLEYSNKEWDGAVKYKDDYSVTNFTDKVTQLMMLCRDLQLPSEQFIKIELKRLVHEFDGKLSTEDIATIEQQIEAMSFSTWQETQKEALVGAPKLGGDGTNSPASQQKSKQTGTMKEAQSESKGANTAATKKLKGK